MHLIVWTLVAYLSSQLDMVLTYTPKDFEPSFGETVENLTVTKGRDAILVCVTENLGDYKVAWVKVDTQTILTIGSHLITRNYRISLTNSDRRVWYLRIASVSRQDCGWYMCQINTDPMKLQSGYLQVVEPPDIVLEASSHDQVVLEGGTVRLRCLARGYPAPTIVWRRENGPPLRSNLVEDTFVNETDVVLSPVHRYHMGVYFCVASNDVPPSVSKRVVLEVQFTPRVNVTRHLVRVTQNSHIVLQCDVEGFPSPVTYWVKGHRDVVTSDSRHNLQEVVSGYRVAMSLKIGPVKGADFTSYMCVAKNTLGEAHGTIRLTERQPTATEREALQKQRRKQKQRENWRHLSKDTITKNTRTHNRGQQVHSNISEDKGQERNQAELRTTSTDWQDQESSYEKELFYDKSTETSDTGIPDSSPDTRIHTGLLSSCLLMITAKLLDL